MMEVQYFRGPRELYNINAHGAGIYFATDTKEILHNGLSFIGELPADLQAAVDRIKATEEALVILNGTGEGSVQKQINDAIDTFATQLSDNGVVDTFKELVNYAAENAGDLGNLILRVDNLEVNDAKQDGLILELQTELETFKGEVEMKLTENSVKLEEKMDEKITDAFSWEDVQ